MQAHMRRIDENINNMQQKQNESFGEYGIVMDSLKSRLDAQDVEIGASKMTIGYLQNQCDSLIGAMHDFRIQTTEEIKAEL